jgi:hypothetical protein
LWGRYSSVRFSVVRRPFNSAFVASARGRPRLDNCDDQHLGLIRIRVGKLQEPNGPRSGDQKQKTEKEFLPCSGHAAPDRQINLGGPLVPPR